MSSVPVFVCARIRPITATDGVRVMECRGMDDSVSVYTGSATAEGDESNALSATNSRQFVEEQETSYFDLTLDESGDDGCDATAVCENQSRVFEALGRSMVEAAFRGVTTAVVAYGPTSGGKSHTVFGTPSAPGLASRVLESLLAVSTERCDSRFATTTLHVSMFDLSFEKVRELLPSSTDSAASSPPAGHNHHHGKLLKSSTLSPQQISLSRRAKSTVTLLADDSVESEFRDCRVRAGPSGYSVDGILKREVRAAAELDPLIFGGLRRRCGPRSRGASSTAANPSHVVLQAVWTQTDKVRGTSKTSGVWFVDCCASDSSHRSRVGPGAAVYKSLNALRSVVDALCAAGPGDSSAAAGPRHVVPYRESNVTLLLSDVLGGNCKTTVIAAVSPGMRSRDESLLALQFVQGMKTIVCKVTVRESSVEVAVGELHRELTMLKKLVESGGSGDDGGGDGSDLRQDALRQELTLLEEELAAVSEKKASYAAEEAAVRSKLEEQESKLARVQTVLSKKVTLLEASKTLEKELEGVVERQLTASQQMGAEVALREKRNAQLVVHRQRQASIVRRHEQVVRGMEDAKRQEDETRKKEFRALFQSATELQRQRKQVAALRAVNDAVLRTESQLFDRLRELQLQTTAAAELVSEEQLKCDFLSEELDEVVQQWSEANRTRAEAVREHNEAMRDALSQTKLFRQELAKIDAVIEEREAALHTLSFETGIRIVELQAEVDTVFDTLRDVRVDVDAALAQVKRAEAAREAAEAERALLPQLEASLAAERQRGESLSQEIQRVTEEVEALDAEALMMDETLIPSLEAEIRSTAAQHVQARTHVVALSAEQQRLTSYVTKRVFQVESSPSAYSGVANASIASPSGNRAISAGRSPQQVDEVHHRHHKQ